MKQLLKIIIIFIFTFNFIACKKATQSPTETTGELSTRQAAQELTQEELGQELTEAIKNKNWEEVDKILDFVPNKPEELPQILKIIDAGDLEQFKKQIKKTDEYIHIKTVYNDCIAGKVALSITPLGYAVEKNKIEIVRFLLSQNTNTEKGVYNKVVGQNWSEVKSPLFIAISNRNKKIAKLLISRWADPNFVYDEISGDCENTSSSVLIEAVKWGDKDIINAFLLKRVDVNQILWQGDNKVSALDFAEDEEIKQILVNAGAKYSKDLK